MSSSAHNSCKKTLSKFLSFPWAGCLLCLFTAGVMEVFHISPFINSFSNYIGGFISNIPDDMPQIHLDNKGMHLQGTMPFVLQSKHGSAILFTSHPDTIWLMDKAEYSIVISDSVVYFKTSSAIKKYPTEGWKSDDPVNITPQRLRWFVGFYMDVGRFFLHALAVMLGLLFTVTVVVIGAGVGSIADGFSNGPFGFRQLVRLSAVIFLLFTFAGVIASKWDVGFWNFWKTALPVFGLSLFALVEYLIHKIYRQGVV